MGMPLIDWIVLNSLAFFGHQVIAAIALLVILAGVLAIMRVNWIISLLFFGGIFSWFALPADKGGLGLLPIEFFFLVLIIMALITTYAGLRLYNRRYQ